LSRSRSSRALGGQPEDTEGSESRERRSYGVSLTLAERRPTGSRGRRKPADDAAGSRSPSDGSDQTRQRTEDHGRVLFIYEEDDEDLRSRRRRRSRRDEATRETDARRPWPSAMSAAARLFSGRPPPAV